MSEEKLNGSSFRALLVAQFLGAMNDNLLQLLVSLIVVNRLVEADEGLGTLVLVKICFVLPFLIFSPFAGSLSDRIPKPLVLRFAKLFEVGVMIIAWIFLLQANVTLLLGALFLLGIQATLFSPAKYGLLPEILAREDLSRGNGYLEMLTFVAIIFGTAIGGILGSVQDGANVQGGVLVVGALLGLLAALAVPVRGRRPHTDRGLPPWRYNPLSIFQTLREIRNYRGVYLTVLAIGYFWAIGSFVHIDILLYSKRALGLGDIGTALLVTSLGFGIGVGSLFAGVVSAGKVELGLVPLGAVVMALGTLLLGAANPGPITAGALLLMLGVGAGAFIVPLNAYLQQESPADLRGSFIAASNFVAFVGVIGASLLLLLLSELFHLGPETLLLVVAFSAIVTAVFVCRLMPGVLIRCINWIVAHTVYRLDVRGLENVPPEGGALIVCNHVAYVDPTLIMASLDRPVRFLMYRPIYDAPLINPIARAVEAIPIAPEDSRRQLVQALTDAREAIKRGELVCIFAEGGLTRLGHMLRFGRGLEMIMKGVDAPIIPAFIDQVWGSIFSFRNGKFFWKRPREIPYPVTIAYGRRLPAAAQSATVRQTILELAANVAIERRERSKLLPTSFLHQCKRSPFRTAVVDSSGMRFRFGTLLGLVLALRSRLVSRLVEGERMIGILVPPSAGGVLANVSSMLCDRVPVNLNHTSGRDALASAIGQCEIRTVITSRKYEEKIGTDLLPDGVERLYLEDLMAGLSPALIAAMAVWGLLLPSRLIERWCGIANRGSDDLATVMFSSGSTGSPKGVMLSHRNIQSNIESLYDLFQVGAGDGVAGILPFFHSFGFTGTLWLPLLTGMKAVYHPDPRESAAVGEMVEREKLTILLSTPTFLLGYIRKCTPEQLKTLRFVVVGAEKLKEKVANAFFERFGIMPMEGYGCTELSPVAIMNVPDVDEGRVSQVGNKPGTVGHPLPGVAVRIVDPDSYEPLPVGEEGLLLVKGPNVMMGYLANEEKTREVVRDGWYRTGDIARMDDDGFITITDRLERFSKIGGEMVPHGKIEEAIHKVLGEVETVCVVTAVPDEKKGEKLIVLCRRDIDSGSVTRQLSEHGLSNLMIPKREHFVRVESFPLLGTGKLDMKAIKLLALQLVEEKDRRVNGDGAGMEQ